MKTVTSSIIICTRNRVVDLMRLLCCIEKQIEQPNQIIIVDSSNNPITEEKISAVIGDHCKQYAIDLVYVHTKPGLTYQRNVGVTHAKGAVLHFLDDDVVLEANYLANMQKIFAQYPYYAGGMGTITNMYPQYNYHYRLIRILFLLQRDYATGIFTWSGMPTHAYGTDTFKNVEVLGGCCGAYRSWVFEHYRFDETLHGYAYMEDCDFSRRVSYAYPLFYNPTARLAHYNSPINRDAVCDNRAMYINNYTYLFFKNFYPYNRFKIIGYCWSIVGLFIEALVLRNKSYIRGYIKGLKQYNQNKKKYHYSN